jgi:hypothetical protein
MTALLAEVDQYECENYHQGRAYQNLLQFVIFIEHGQIPSEKSVSLLGSRLRQWSTYMHVMALTKKVHSQASAEHPAGTGQPIEHGGMTAWDEQLAKLENTSIRAKNRRYRPGASSGIGTDNSNSGDQVSYQMFKPGVETSPDHLLTGCPGSNCKRAEAYPCCDPQRDTRSSHGANMRQKTGLLQHRREQRGTDPAGEHDPATYRR